MSTVDRIATERPLEVAVGRDRALEACHAAVAAALAAGADRASAFLTGRRSGYTRFAVDRVHQPQDIREWTLMVRAESTGRASRVATTDLTAAGAVGRRAADRARALATAFGSLPAGSAAPAVAGDDADASLWVEETAHWDAAARTAAARRTMDAAARAGGAAYGMVHHAATELAVVTGEGVERYARATEAHGSLTVKVADGTSHWTDVDRSLAVLDLEAATARTVREADAAKGRIDLPDGTYDVVLGPLATGGLLERIAAFGFTGEAVADGVGAVARRRGQQVVVPEVDVADDPTARRGLPFPFDLEGTASVRVPLLDRGRVAGAVTDLASAARSGLPATGHAHIAREETPHAVPASITMAAGGDEDLVAGVERGLYVQRLWYLNVIDPETTTLTGGSRDACFLVEDGRLTQPVSPARFSESVFGALGRVDGIGPDVLAQPLMNVWNGCVSAPAVRVRGFRFGGAR
ncbi:TldD/PmbA family protein [Phycicoccus sp. MAQZ13P-2]|uniref:TldD/PmbA family protein n=1 Tax=Phycicoccus mangrovi TaxID=2840470 RepID=UPI001C006261|nr:metallopeptidase TldD-related protein [Phycicoccus mangrovi]MBT9254715.1 TldD/PmbA family protein [Phycicoccus mangrovi]MBT9273080.1 TldD/PmbA family protein [Phycicoccus mangrovi]